MSSWLVHDVVPVLIVLVVLVVVLWPTTSSGARLLRTWGVPEPSPGQVAVAVGYLWRRCVLYVALFIAVPPLARLIWPEGDGGPADELFVPLLASLLIGELLAAVRRVGGVRVASLDQRTWRDLVPRWAVVVSGVLVLLAVAIAAIGVAAQPWADRYAAALPANGRVDGEANGEVFIAAGFRAEIANSTSWLALGNVVVCLVVVVLLVRLAVRRPAHADEAVDTALRTRSARVAVAIGFGWLGAAVLIAARRVDFLDSLDARDLPAVSDAPAWLTAELGAAAAVVGPGALVAAVLCWVWLATPTRRAPVADRR